MRSAAKRSQACNNRTLPCMLQARSACACESLCNSLPCTHISARLSLAVPVQLPQRTDPPSAFLTALVVVSRP